MNIHFNTLMNFQLNIFWACIRKRSTINIFIQSRFTTDQYFLVKGEDEDGHQYIKEAIARGAVAVFGQD